MEDRKENNTPTVIVIFGATGDLAQRKIIPALSHAYKRGVLPTTFKIMGFSRQNLTNETFRDKVKESLGEHADAIEGEDLNTFLECLLYTQGDFYQKDDYAKLKTALGTIDEKWGICSNKLYHLAVLPEFYETIFEYVKIQGLTEACGKPNWSRVIVEKPFGKDKKTAQKIDKALGQAFNEEQIYRIDHYLGKEMVQNILVFRFSNNLFEKTWNSDLIEKIEVKLIETIDISGRGTFYDGAGALRDVGQNHLLQMLALTTMDRPLAFSAEAIREKRFALLKNIRPLSKIDVEKNTVRGQYKGYKETKGVEEDSKTETYFKIQTEINTPRWKSVPVILEGGKALEKEEKGVTITFRHSEPCLCKEEHLKNVVRFSLHPDEKISIDFFSKKQGSGMEIEKREFAFTPHKEGSVHIEEYERLLLEVIRGDQTLFVSTEEVNLMWEFIDPIVGAWEEDIAPLLEYEKNNNHMLD